MNACDVDVLSRYLDGDLSLPARRDMDRHLSTCQDCAAELDVLRRNDHVLWSWGLRRTPLPEAVEQKIMRDVGKRKRLGPLVAISRMMPAAVGTSVAAMLVLVSVTLSGQYAQRQAGAALSASKTAQQTIHKQSKPLLRIRGTQAIVGTGSPHVLIHTPQHRLQFDQN
jgi:anti-sigma factor RsiW